MLMNLFSVFDPVSYCGVGINWVGFCFCLVGLFLCVKKYFFSGVSMFYGGVKRELGGVFSEVGGVNHFGLVYMSFCVCFCFMMFNLLGLLPFVFTVTAHPLVTLVVGFVMWSSFFVMGWVSGFVSSSAHLVPYGSPVVLAPFMVIIESVSNIIRPFTLAIRLAANMMAGHLIMGLLSSMSMSGFGMMVISVVLQSTLLVLEIGVCIIQGFVFSILLMLYVIEYY